MLEAVEAVEKKYRSMSQKELDDLVSMKLRTMLTEEIKNLGVSKDRRVAKKDDKVPTPPKFTMGTNGLVQYRTANKEDPHDRKHREIFWRSLGKKIRKGAAIR